VTLEELEKLAKNPEIDAYLQPVETGLNDLPEMICTETSSVRLRNGNPAIVIPKDSAEYGDEIWASMNGVPVAVGRYKGGELHPSRVFNL